MNQVTFIGNCTKDIELSQTSGGKSIAKFSIAVTRDFDREKTDFFNIQVWNTLGENCAKYLSKGKKVAIVGRIENESYEDKNGNKKISTTVTASSVEFLSPAGGETQNSTATTQPQKKKATELKEVDDEDFSF